MQPGKVIECRAIHVPREVVSAWVQRRTQIYLAETYAVLAALYDHRHDLEGRGVLVFVDNEAAASSIIRGAPRMEDVGTMVHLIHILAHSYGMRLWVEWIDSESNPSDGLSRDGLRDRWTLQQQWSLAAGDAPTLQLLSEAFRPFL